MLILLSIIAAVATKRNAEATISKSVPATPNAIEPEFAMDSVKLIEIPSRETTSTTGTKFESAVLVTLIRMKSTKKMIMGANAPNFCIDLVLERVIAKKS